MKKQQHFLGFEEDKKESIYTSKIEAPVYEPKNRCPKLRELYDRGKTARLVAEIENADISPEEKRFLLEAAGRHTVFNYEKIADYYAHASEEMQELMEQSALVIIDFDSAIEHGFVRLCKNIQEQYLNEYPTEEE